MKYYRTSVTISAVTLTLLFAAACSNVTEKENVSKVTQNEEKQQPAEVVIYSSSGGTVESFDLLYGTALRAKFPHYTIKYIQSAKGTALPDMLSSKTRFDIIYENTANYLAYMAQYDLGYDMTELIKKHQVDLNPIEPAMLEALTQSTGGKVYALPVYNNSLVMFYNKSVFDKFGVPHPKDGMLWEQLIETAQRLTRKDGDTSYYGFTQAASHTLRLNPLGVSVADTKTNTPTVNTDDRWKRLIETIYVQPSTSPVYQEFMKKNKRAPVYNDFLRTKNVGMLAYLAGFAGSLAAAPDLDWDMVALPVFKESPKVGSQASPIFFGITEQAKNKDAAMEVLKYLISAEFQTGLARKGTMPVLKDEAVKKAYGLDTAYKDKHLEALFYNEYAPTPAKATYDVDLTNMYADYATKVQIGELDINTALRQAEEKARQIIAEALK